MTTTEQDARALTYLATRLRAETHKANAWDQAGTFAVISELIGQSLPLVTERVTRHASDPKAKTPGAIRRPFVPDAPKSEAYKPPKREEACPIHLAHYRDNCAGCMADRKATDAHETPPIRPARPASPEVAQRHIQAARAALRGSKEDA